MQMDHSTKASHPETLPSEQEAIDMSPTAPAEIEHKAEPAVDDDASGITGIKLVFLLTSLTIACFLIMLDASVVSTVANTHHISASAARLTVSSLQAIPTITDEFHSLADIGWYGSAYQLGRYYTRILCRSMSEC